MKKMIFLLIACLVLSCAREKELSPSDTAKIVAKSFLSKDKSTLKEYTTTDGYSSMITILNMMPNLNKEIEVEILDEVADGEIVWIKYSTNYDGKTGVFKLIKEAGQWKVTNKKPRDRGPF